MSKTVSELQQEIKQFCKERDWDQFHDPKNLALSLSLESSEVLELFQWTKDNQIKDSKKEEIGDEIADVLYWTIMLANYYEIDLVEALTEKMQKNAEKYPIDKAWGKSEKYDEL